MCAGIPLPEVPRPLPTLTLMRGGTAIMLIPGGAEASGCRGGGPGGWALKRGTCWRIGRRGGPANNGKGRR